MSVLRRNTLWKNTEDEIMRAAVMRYGKNQWARIASLLHTRTARECKARWFEWLDPAIKKAEWSKDEEKKLLHLFKIMPSQPRSIGPLLGRTTTQCLEHYHRLLDAATGTEFEDPMDDPRRLKPGEIDFAPESRGTAPDTVDITQQEREMLQEAKARLANTKGKKYKRRLREKKLEEARRLAALQKRRELKAAGINTPNTPKKRSRMTPYNQEIPFRHRPPPGFHSTVADDIHEKESRENYRFAPVYLHQLEGERRDDVEQRLRQEDIQKLNLRNKDPNFVLENAKSNKPRRRERLILPAPQISDAELAQLTALCSSCLDENKDEPTTELLGRSVPATPKRFVEASCGRTPKRRKVSGGTFLRSNRYFKHLSDGFASLPAPDPFKVELPQTKIQHSQTEQQVLEDLEVRAFELDLMNSELKSQVLQRGLPRPFCIDTNLPQQELNTMENATEQELETRASEILQAELKSMLIYDALMAPTEQIKRPDNVNAENFVREFIEYNHAELKESREMLHQATQVMINDYGIHDFATFTKTWEECFEDLIYVPHLNKFGLNSDIRSTDIKSKSLQFKNENMIQQLNLLTKKVQDLEKAANVYLVGYLKLAAEKEKYIQSLNQQIEERRSELSCFQMLAEIEDRAIPLRVQGLQNMLEQQRQQESILQERYVKLLNERDTLLVK